MSGRLEVPPELQPCVDACVAAAKPPPLEPDMRHLHDTVSFVRGADELRPGGTFACGGVGCAPVPAAGRWSLAGFEVVLVSGDVPPSGRQATLLPWP